MVSILIKNGIIVTSDAKNRIIGRGAIAIDKDKIVEVGPTKEIEKKYSADQSLNADGKVVLPGMICCHNHMYNAITHAMPWKESPTSFIGFLEDLWWPYIEDQFTKDQIYASSLIASARMIKSGVTSFADVLEAPNAIPGALDREAEAVRRVGIRGVLSFEASERVSEENADLSVKENLGFVRKWNKKDDLVKGKFCTHTTFSCSEKLLRRVRKLADEYGGGIHIHLEEGRDESMFSHVKYRKTPAEFYEDIGYLGPDVLASQCVYTTDREIEVFKRHNVKVSHQPISNSEIGSTVAPVVKYLKAGLTVGFGTDGSTYDLYEVMRFAFLLHKAYHQDMAVMSPKEVFRMATRGGAEAIGMGEMVGSIEPNKKADLQILDLKSSTPVTPENVLTHLVLLGNGGQVETVLVDGKIVMRDRKVLTVDEQAARKLAMEAAEDLWQVLKKDRKDLPFYRV
ncbi:MAG TPA: amidohydrolase [Candidatus Bathyarchaeia archaeon]|nr:amidohydrolase [Candidatus Bathyarchaeia archaeon]